MFKKSEQTVDSILSGINKTLDDLVNLSSRKQLEGIELAEQIQELECKRVAAIEEEKKANRVFENIRKLISE